MNEPPNRYENTFSITPDGEVFQIQIRQRRVTNASQVIKSMTPNVGSVIQNLLFINDIFCVHLFSSESKRIMATRLNEIPLNALFYRSGDAFLPDFERSNDSERMQLNWTPPKDCYAYFVYCEKLNSSGGISERPLCYFIFIDKSTKRIYRPAFPNLYDSGKICMGDAWNPVQYEGLTSRFHYSLQDFLSSEWNADLIPPTHLYRNLIRISSKTKNTLKPTRDWQGLCGENSGIVSNGCYNWVASSIVDKEIEVTK